MQKLLHLPTVLCVVVSTACSEIEEPQDGAELAGSYSNEQPAPPESFFSEVASAPVETQELSETEPGSRGAGVQLARMTVSEATSLQPINDTWQLDMQGILQVARNTQGVRQSLLESLKELSPHVGAVTAFTDDRQQWLSTLPARGDGPPRLWEECIGWETVQGRKRGIPKGCHGAWEAGAKNWVTIRTYAIELIGSTQPSTSVLGEPIAWGGIMDISAFLERRPNLCWLESGLTVNYFFGLKTNPANVCKPIPVELVKESRTVSADIVARSLRRKTLEE